MLRKSKPAVPEKPSSGLQSKITKNSKTTATAPATKYTCNYHVCLALVTKCTNSAPFPNGICQQHLAAAQSVVDYHSMMKESHSLSPTKESPAGAQSGKNKDCSDEDEDELPIVCQGCFSRFHEDDIELFDCPDGTIDPLCKTCFKISESNKTKEEKKVPSVAISWDN